MSMFSDILWKKDDENCISNAEKVRNYAKKFLPGHWTFLGPGSEKRWYGDSHDQKGQWERRGKKMVQRFKETGHLAFKSTSALDRGILKHKRGKNTINFNGDPVNTEPLFQTVHSVNRLSVYGAVTDWCYQFGLTDEEKEQVVILVDNKNLTMLEPQEVEMLVSPPNLALGNKMQFGKCWVLEKRMQMTQLCEKIFQHLVTARNCYQIRRDDEDGWRNLLLCAENTQILDLIRKAEFGQLFPQVQLLDQFWKFIL